MGKLAYQTLRENIVDIIRMRIFNHELLPGARLIEQDISEELGVSRGPIREALRQLEQEGLIEYTRNVGCSIKRITLEDIYEIYLLRSTYEILSVRMCDGKFSKETLAQMEEALFLLEHIDEVDYGKIIDCDNMFHSAIIQSTNLPRLIKVWTDLNYGNIISYYAGNTDSLAMMKRQFPIHKELYDICCTQDTDAICKAISEHYMSTIQRRLKEEGLSEAHFDFSIGAISGWI